MRTIYSLVFTIGFYLASPWYFFRIWRRGNWREGFGERFGKYSSRVKQALSNRQVVWLHGVSVGEANLAALLALALERRLPHLKFVVSTTTTTGMGELRRKLPVVFEKIYFPIDRRPWVRRAFAVLHPEILVLLEAELWPNVLWHARRRRVPVVLANARISQRSFRRYRRTSMFFRQFFRGLSGVTAQSERDAERLEALGCRKSVLQSVGSLKFEGPPAADQRVIDVPSVLRAAGMPEDALVLLGSSTHEGEEAILADTFRRLRRKHPSLYLVLVPRHFERSRTVGSQLDRRRVRFVYRSEVTPSTPHPPGSIDCLVVNSTGELRHFYPHASVVFIGKSLVGRGGQTPIEAAAAGRALLFGPNMQNFPDIAPRFLAADGAVQVADKEQLETELDRLFSDPKRRQELGRNAHAVVEANRGALEKTVAMIVDILAERGVVTE